MGRRLEDFALEPSSPRPQTAAPGRRRRARRGGRRALITTLVLCFAVLAPTSSASAADPPWGPSPENQRSAQNLALLVHEAHRDSSPEERDAAWRQAVQTWALLDWTEVPEPDPDGVLAHFQLTQFLELADPPAPDVTPADLEDDDRVLAAEQAARRSTRWDRRTRPFEVRGLDRAPDYGSRIRPGRSESVQAIKRLVRNEHPEADDITLSELQEQALREWLKMRRPPVWVESDDPKTTWTGKKEAIAARRPARAPPGQTVPIALPGGEYAYVPRGTKLDVEGYELVYPDGRRVSLDPTKNNRVDEADETDEPLAANAVEPDPEDPQVGTNLSRPAPVVPTDSGQTPGVVIGDGKQNEAPQVGGDRGFTIVEQPRPSGDSCAFGGGSSTTWNASTALCPEFDGGQTLLHQGGVPKLSDPPRPLRIPRAWDCVDVADIPNGMKGCEDPPPGRRSLLDDPPPEGSTQPGQQGPKLPKLSDPAPPLNIPPGDCVDRLGARGLIRCGDQARERSPLDDVKAAALVPLDPASADTPQPGPGPVRVIPPDAGEPGREPEPEPDARPAQQASELIEPDPVTLILDEAAITAVELPAEPALGTIEPIAHAELVDPVVLTDEPQPATDQAVEPAEDLAVVVEPAPVHLEAASPPVALPVLEEHPEAEAPAQPEINLGGTGRIQPANPNLGGPAAAPDQPETGLNVVQGGGFGFLVD